MSNLMKNLRYKKMYLMFLFVLGVAMFIISNFVYKQATGGYASSVGIVFIVISILKFFQYLRLEKNPERMKQFATLNSDERVEFVVTKARNMMFFITIVAEFIIFVIAATIGKEQISMAVAAIVCVQTLGYAFLYWYYDKKY